jgi:hypothetical protein
VGEVVRSQLRGHAAASEQGLSAPRVTAVVAVAVQAVAVQAVGLRRRGVRSWQEKQTAVQHRAEAESQRQASRRVSVCGHNPPCHQGQMNGRAHLQLRWPPASMDLVEQPWF